MSSLNRYKYCNCLTEYSRFNTREVFIGDVPLGGSNPIRIQSMTTTNTLDTQATVDQTIRMIESGSEYVRITAPSLNEAKNLEKIKNELVRRGYNIPLIADIHFTPNAAEYAARIIEKVRINPGNYADKKKFNQIEYSDEEYKSEIERISERFIPLIKICKEYGTAMRIGTNHGSLSDRIMSRYGDTPLGMVESALEFVRICEENNYYDIVLSMKASNPKVMVHAYRLLVNKMIEEGMNYPLHLGVTEAGDGEDARVKSAVGIGTLLEDGLGDTVRVSLTEPPENEAPVAKELVDRYKNRKGHNSIISIDSCETNPFEYTKRTTTSFKNIGGTNVPVVIADFSKTEVNYSDLKSIGYEYNAETDKWTIKDSAADFIYLGKNKLNFELPQNLFTIHDYSIWNELESNVNSFPFFNLEELAETEKYSAVINFVEITIADITKSNFAEIIRNKNIVLVISTNNEHGMAEQRRMFFELLKREINNPVIIRRGYSDLNDDQFLLYSSIDAGALLIDGFGDGLWLNQAKVDESKLELINRTSFGILQGTRTRITKTEYIACPSCGRTLFDLVEVTNKIRSRTEHLKGVKIGIMGCIVNGPGEMADADYGYVGSGIGKITLYRGKEIVRKNLDEKEAVDELIELIKEDGNWIEKI